MLCILISMNNEVLCSRCKAASYIRYSCPLFVSPRARACITTFSCTRHSLDFFEDGAPLLTLLVKGWQQRGANIIIDTSASKSSIRWFVITEKAPTRAFSWLKAAITAFTFKTLLRHYAKQAFTPRSLNMKLGPRHKSQKGRAGWLA